MRCRAWAQETRAHPCGRAGRARGRFFGVRKAGARRQGSLERGRQGPESVGGGCVGCRGSCLFSQRRFAFVAGRCVCARWEALSLSQWIEDEEHKEKGL